MRNKQGRYLADLTPAVILPLITEHRGNLASIARELGVSRSTVQDRVGRSQELQQALVDARESMIDDAITSLHNKVMGGDTVATIFFLKTQGWRRGFAERKQVDVNVSEMEGHTDTDDNVMTLEKWKIQQQKRIAQVEETMSFFEEEDDAIETEYTKS